MHRAACALRLPLCLQKHGWPMLGIRRSRLRSACLEAMQAMDVPLQLGKRLAGIDNLPAQQAGSSGAQQHPQGPVTLAFEDGSSFEADLVVGCDGLNSRTRAVLKDGGEAPPRQVPAHAVFCRLLGAGPGHQRLVMGQVHCWLAGLAARQVARAWSLASDEVCRVSDMYVVVQLP